MTVVVTEVTLVGNGWDEGTPEFSREVTTLPVAVEETDWVTVWIAEVESVVSDLSGTL